MTLDQHRAAEALERALGDPSDESSAFSFDRAVALDDAEAYPEEACDRLDAFGLSRYYVPIAFGGALESFEETSFLMRAVARRDLTVAIAHAKTYLGSVAVLCGGTVEQKSALADIVLDRGQVSLALTERDHGSDLLSTEVSATAVDGGYRLSGEKWLINNATRGRALTVFAKTDERRSPRSFSLFFVDKRAVDEHQLSRVPKIHTHGIRGADISGIRFDGCLVPSDALVGKVGTGLEIMLRSLQITRTLIVSLSLGSSDTALRLATSIRGRGLEDDRVLCEAFLDLLTADALAIAAARALHVVPEQASVISSVVKYFVPARLEAACRRLARLLGPNAVLRSGPASGVFQKLVRDNALVSLFDGSSVVNLNALAQQLQLIAAQRPSRADAELDQRLRSIFDLRAPLPPFDSDRLTLSSRGRDDLHEGLSATIEPDPVAEPEVLERIRSTVRRFIAAQASDREAILHMAAGSGRTQSQPTLLFDHARRHTIVSAAAACLAMWRHNREHLGAFFARGLWLGLALERLAGELDHREIRPSRGDLDHLLGELSSRAAGGLFSNVPLTIAGGARERR